MYSKIGVVSPTALNNKFLKIILHNLERKKQAYLTPSSFMGKPPRNISFSTYKQDQLMVRLKLNEPSFAP